MKNHTNQDLYKLIKAICSSALTKNDSLYYQDIDQLIYELNYYQVEIEIENEFLLRTQRELEDSLSRYGAIVKCCVQRKFSLGGCSFIH
jgi:hypothetical protein